MDTLYAGKQNMNLNMRPVNIRCMISELHTFSVFAVISRTCISNANSMPPRTTV